MSNTQQLQDATDAPVDPAEYKWHFSRAPVKKRQYIHIYRFRHPKGGHQKWSLSFVLMGDLSKSSSSTQNSLNCCERAGATKVTVDHVPAADAGLLFWYVHTLITQAAKHRVWSFPSFFWECFRLLKLTLLGLFLWRLWVGHLIWAPCFPLTYTHTPVTPRVCCSFW